MLRRDVLAFVVAALVLAQLPRAVGDLVRPSLQRSFASRIDTLRAGEVERIAAAFPALPRERREELRAFARAYVAIVEHVPPDGTVVLLVPDEPGFGLVADRLGALLYPRRVRLVRLDVGASLPRVRPGAPVTPGGTDTPGAPGLVVLRIGESCAHRLPA